MARILVNGRQAATLAEALLALGLFVVVVLLAVALAVASLRTNQKGSDVTIGSAWGTQVLENFVYGVPPSSDSFWSTTGYSSPYQTDTIQLGSTSFAASLFVTDLAALGSGVKLVTVNVTWGSGTIGEEKAGVGQQVTTVSRLLYAH